MIDDHRMDELKVQAKLMAAEIIMKHDLAMLGDRVELNGGMNNVSTMGMETQPVVPEAIPSGGMDNAVGLQS